MPKLLDKIHKWVGNQPIIVQLLMLFFSAFLVISLLIAAFNGA